MAVEPFLVTRAAVERAESKVTKESEVIDNLLGELLDRGDWVDQEVWLIPSCWHGRWSGLDAVAGATR